MMKIDRYKERIQNMLFMRIFPDKHAQLSEVRKPRYVPMILLIAFTDDILIDRFIEHAICLKCVNGPEKFYCIPRAFECK